MVIGGKAVVDNSDENEISPAKKGKNKRRDAVSGSGDSRGNADSRGSSEARGSGDSR